MPIVYITRLRLRSLGFLPVFMVHSLSSARQARQTPGFLGGRLLSDGAYTYWTVTVWRDGQSMKNFRDSGAHKRAMPKLKHWCDEAATAHTEKDGPDLPSPEAIYEHLQSNFRLSKVAKPSAAQADGRLSDNLRPPRPGMKLTPL
jgi:heme-degrading monooxygenase HmoA